jgi:hypothetical protein
VKKIARIEKRKKAKEKVSFDQLFLKTPADYCLL